MTDEKVSLQSIVQYCSGILTEKGKVGRDDILRKYKSNQFMENQTPDSVDFVVKNILKTVQTSNSSYVLIDNGECSKYSSCIKRKDERKGCDDKKYTTKCLSLILEKRI